MWAELEDLFSNAMMTGLPAEGALTVARRFEQEWLDTPPERFEAFLAAAATSWKRCAALATRSSRLTPRPSSHGWAGDSRFDGA